MSKRNKSHKNVFYDSSFKVEEQLPRNFSVTFKEIGVGSKGEVRVIFNNESQVGDIINDNSYINDFYRYHDIFHYTFAAMLGWSPCARAMMKRKRKSNQQVDEIEDGARATITEEAISLILFNDAKGKNFYEEQKVSKELIEQIKDMAGSFEVRDKTEKDWENAIMKAYELFRNLKQNGGGKIVFDMLNKNIQFIAQN